MKIILQKDVKKLGKKGEAKEVADGFARNYLIPKGLAIQATENDMREIQKREKHEAKAAEKDLATAQQVAAELDGEEVVITEKANEHGELYAAVSANEIAAAVKKRGQKISPRQIVVERPLKTLGEHMVTISLNDGIEAELRVIVESEDDKTETDEQEDAA